MSAKTRFFACLCDRGAGFAGLAEAVDSVTTAAELKVRCL